MRLIFAGTPAAAIPTLRRLAEEHEVVGVVTRPDAPLGRKRMMTPSPVAVVAEELGLSILKHARLTAEATEQLAALEADLGVIVAYGGLVREPLLSTPRHGWINLHFSELPAWRGAAPVQRALIAGENDLGLSVFQLVAELDAGPLFGTARVAVPREAVAGDALGILADAGAPLVASIVEQIGAGTIVAVPQEGAPSFAAKLSFEDGALDWQQRGDAIYARYRGVTPEPGAHTLIGGIRVKVLEARLSENDETLAPGEIRATKEDILIGTASAPLAVSRVQPAAKAAMRAVDWWRGLRADENLRAGS